MSYALVASQMLFFRRMRKRSGHIGSGPCSLVSVVIPVFDTLVIIVTEASYELQKKVAHI